MESKVCTQCLEQKTFDQFGNDKRSKDGKETKCKACVKENRHDYYLRNKQEIIQKVARWQKNNIEKTRSWKRAYELRTHEWQKKRKLALSKSYYVHNKDMVDSKRRARYARSPRLQISNQKRVSKWRLDNPGKAKKLRQDYYLNNQGEVKSKVSRWVKENQDRANANKHNYEARKFHNGGCHSHLDWYKVKEEFNFTCLRCGKQEPEIKLTQDHVIPISKGGSNDISNIQPLCHSCNSSKSAKHIDYREIARK
jgi:5-methylcytosine-specific restriction endonuclease McrA